MADVCFAFFDELNGIFKELLKMIMSETSEHFIQPEEIYFDSLTIDAIELVGESRHEPHNPPKRGKLRRRNMAWFWLIVGGLFEVGRWRDCGQRAA